jgi:hypothetical protein
MSLDRRADLSIDIVEAVALVSRTVEATDPPGLKLKTY